MIYLDHAATCAMRPAALDAEISALKNLYGNASPSYPPAQEARAALDQARTDLAGTIGADWKDIFFTSGGTEGDNWALIGAAEASESGIPADRSHSVHSAAKEDSSGKTIPREGAGEYRRRRGHIITSQVEHHAVLHTCLYLESRGFTVSYLPVDREGFVNPGDLRRELENHPDTFLVSIMTANNEVGTIEPVRELVSVVRRFEEESPDRTGTRRRILFHTDAVQAYGKIPIDVEDLDVDLLSVSAHKIGGPKGIGFLYIRRGTELASLMHGGAQESGRRAGTENVPAAVGFAAAAVDASANMPGEQEREAGLQAYFYRKLKDTFPSIVWNGPKPGNQRLYNNVSVSFPGQDQRTLLMNLDLAGICASGGSACTTGALDPSHVIMAMTGRPDVAAGTLRFTLGPENTESEIDETVRVLAGTIARL